MLFIDKRNKIAPNIYIIDIGGYFNNDFEGRLPVIAPLLNSKTDKGKMKISGTLHKFSSCKGHLTVICS